MHGDLSHDLPVDLAHPCGQSFMAKEQNLEIEIRKVRRVAIRVWCTRWAMASKDTESDSARGRMNMSNAG